MKMKPIKYTLLLMVATSTASAEPAKQAAESKKSSVAKSKVTELTDQKKAIAPSAHRRAASDAEIMDKKNRIAPGKAVIEKATLADGDHKRKASKKGRTKFIHFDPANTDIITSCGSKNPKGYLRYRPENNSFVSTHVNEGSEFVINWRNSKAKQSEEIVEIYSIKPGQDVSKIDTTQTKPLHSIKSKTNSIKSSDLPKPLPVGYYVWRVISSLNGELLSVSNPELLRIHGGEEIIEKLSAHRRRKSLEYQGGCILYPKLLARPNSDSNDEIDKLQSGHKRKPSKDGIRTERIKFIHYNPENKNTITSCVGVNEKDYLRFKAEDLTPIQTHAELGAELVFSWKEQTEQKGELFFQMYSLKEGQRSDRVDPSTTKPLYSFKPKGNTLKLSSFPKELAKGTYLWVCVRMVDGKVVSRSNPELLGIHSGSDFEENKPASNHRKRPTKRNWSICPPWHK